MPTAVGSATASPWGTWVCSEAGQGLVGPGVWSWKDDKVGGSNNEQKDGTEQGTTEQMTTSGTKKTR